MAGQPSFVVVGAGMAGARAVEALREEGFDGRVRLLGAESAAPYDRPPLSKGFLLGDASREEIDLLAPGWFRDNEVDLSAGVSVTSLDLADRQVLLDDGGSVGFDKLLLATGSRPRALDVPGAGLDGVRYLRVVEDSMRLREDLSGGGRRVVVIGGGWIGLEVAAAARTYGNDVVVVEPQPTVLHAALGPELGEVFAALHRDHGVDLRTKAGAVELRGRDGRVTAVVVDAGGSRSEVAADLVVVGIGATPRTELAEQAGLDVDNGVVVDAHLRTSHPDVYAAGDIARWFHPRLGRRLRVEHWENARASGPAAARAMLEMAADYDPVPYFFTDQYDLGMEYAGDLGDGYDRVVLRGDRDAGEFIAFWLLDSRVVAAMNVNVWDVNDTLKGIVRSGSPVDPNRLADPDAALDSLVAAGGQ